MKNNFRKKISKLIFEQLSSDDLKKEMMNRIEQIKSDIAMAAQGVYNEWGQDEDGHDEVYGSGGICDDIAEKICDVISEKLGYSCTHFYNEYDCHTSAYVFDEENEILIMVDIPFGYYETGGGYTWKKIKDVELLDRMVHIQDMSSYYHEYMSNDLSESTGSKINWNPLYLFLKEIFGDKYEKAADAFMFMGENEDYGRKLYFYKNGFTRKTLPIDESGVVYSINSEGKASHISYHDAFNILYKDIDKFLDWYQKEPGETKLPEDIYLIAYNQDYIKKRTKKLSDLGYKTVTMDKDNLNADFLKENSIAYSAVVVDDEDVSFFEEMIEKNLSEMNIVIPEDFKKPSDYHMTIKLGEMPLSLKMRGDLSRHKDVELYVHEIGFSDDAIAFKVQGYMSKNDVQHITIAFREKPESSKAIQNWMKIPFPFNVQGHIEEVVGDK